MCGIFGAVFAKGSPVYRTATAGAYLEKLFVLSASRGKEAAGVAMTSDTTTTIYRDDAPATEIIGRRDYRSAVQDALTAASAADTSQSVAFIGHSRLVTNGVSAIAGNNQPIQIADVVGVHNGIVVNADDLWAANPELTRRNEVDSEVIFALMRAKLEAGGALAAVVRETFSQLQGATSIGATIGDRDALVLATNNGSLYYRATAASDAVVFASESYILETLSRSKLDAFRDAPTRHVRPREMALIDLASLEIDHLEDDRGSEIGCQPSSRRELADRSPKDRRPPRPRRHQPPNPEELARRFPSEGIEERLRRCTRCILPHTMPFIEFDEDGVCSYCRSYTKLEVRGGDELERLLAPHRRTDGRPDCIVGVSGGRDSVYGLHYMKTVLGLNPVAYTYDWGMVTDLARRNTSRICGALGVEHILVSADIIEKRAFIRKNVSAWLARPSLGTIPLFMAGDKAYFYHLTKVREQLGITPSVLCENLLERTHFKTGFARVPPIVHDEDHVYTMSALHKARLIGFYGLEFVRNPRYINSSLWDSAKAFAYYYFIDRDYINLYRYVEWDEDTVVKTLRDYDFEMAPDTTTTWRIGDGTAAFYNYIYYAVAGFTENDTFRSNQIREGVITREDALARVARENRPRFPTIIEYLETIGLELPVERVLQIIASIPRLYE